MDGQGLLKHLGSQETLPVRREYQVYVGELLAVCGGGGFFKPSIEDGVLTVIGYTAWKLMEICV